MARIHQEITFPTSPERVYRALADAGEHASFTGAPAEIDARPGGAWSAYGGKIGGFTLEVVPGQRLVQAWRAGDWAPGVYSVVRFEVTADAAGAKLTLDHDALPDVGADHIDGGWHKMYWEPLRAHLG